jgi:hypothetical protein
MDATFPLVLHPRDLPLWRLIVALDDAERTLGPDSDTARVLACAIQERLRSRTPSPGPSPQEVAHAS